MQEDGVCGFAWMFSKKKKNIYVVEYDKKSYIFTLLKNVQKSSKHLIQWQFTK